MVNVYAPGDRVRAPVLRDRTSSIVMLSAPVTTLLVQPAFVDAPGLSLPVRPNSRYMIDAWFGMGGGNVGDMAWRFVGPPDNFLTWTAIGPQLDQTDGIGIADWGRYISPEFVTLGCGSVNMGIHATGRLITRGFGGNLGVQFAKNAESVGFDAHIMRGSWMRIFRVDPALFEGI